jgi:hypothetical protein
VHGVCFLAAVKILTAKSNRDYLYTGVVAFIELIGAAVLSFQASFFGWLALYVFFAIAAFTSAEIRRGVERSPRISHGGRVRMGWRLSMVAGAATCGILAITAGLFLIVPAPPARLPCSFRTFRASPAFPMWWISGLLANWARTPVR